MAVFAAYILTFPLAHRFTEGGEVVLALLWTALAGWHFGPSGGAIAGLTNIVVEVVLFKTYTLPSPFPLSGELPALAGPLLAGPASGLLRRHLERLRKTQASLREAKAFLERIVASAPIITFRREGAGLVLTYISPNLERILGYSPEELLGSRFTDALERVHPDDRQKLTELLAAVLDSGHDELLFRLRHRSEGYRWFYLVAHLAPNAPRSDPVVLGYMLDFTAQVESERALKDLISKNRALFTLAHSAVTSNKLEHLFHQAVAIVKSGLDASHVAILKCDLPQGALPLLAGYGFSKNIPGEPTANASDSHAGYAAHAGKTIASPDLSRERRFQPGNIWRQAGVKAAIAAPIPGARGTYGVLAVAYPEPRDFRHEEVGFVETAAYVLGSAVRRVLYERRIKELAYYDPLTGLGNRLKLDVEARRILSAAREKKRSVALLFLDIDHFSKVNNVLGHDVGDTVLQEVASRLRTAKRDSDALARIGGDEFVLLLANTGHEEAVSVARGIEELLGAPYSAGEHRITIHASIGIALFPEHATTLEELMREADAAMYRAKEHGETFRFYTPKDTPPSPERLDLATDLKVALERGDLTLHYQPILDLREGTVTKVEALLRWNHPQHGPVSPAVFIPLAEEVGLIADVDRYALEKAVQQAADWLRSGTPLAVSVNLSPRCFWQMDPARILQQLLLQAGIAPGLLTLEITERVLASPEQATPILEELRALGVRVAVDDFGVGYSSLRYLREFPLDALKIDRAFVKEIGIHEASEAIVRTVITLAHELGLLVLAEGVETGQQLTWLKSERCDLVQGYLIGKPLPPEELRAG